jgi:hypothetical protein
MLAYAGFSYMRGTKMTAEKVREYARSQKISELRGEERARAIRGLADRLNRLSPEERRRARLDRVWSEWFEEMSEEEKSGFIDATLPTGFRQMLSSFEQLPEERRRRAVSDAVRRMREAEQEFREEGGTPAGEGTNPPVVLSEEMQQKVVKTGLRTFYSESSAQSKAELAPVLEEIQRQMEGGRFFRPPRESRPE